MISHRMLWSPQSCFPPHWQHQLLTHHTLIPTPFPFPLAWRSPPSGVLCLLHSIFIHSQAQASLADDGSLLWISQEGRAIFGEKPASCVLFTACTINPPASLSHSSLLNSIILPRTSRAHFQTVPGHFQGLQVRLWAWGILQMFKYLGVAGKHTVVITMCQSTSELRLSGVFSWLEIW